MASRQKIRSEETKQAILTAAGQLFAVRGFDAVTMREIAKEAGCSHTTIYIYFKDKEALLHQLSLGPLQTLRQQMEAVLGDQALSPEARFKLLTRGFVQFCFSHRNMYTILFMAKASRVDEDQPALEIQRLRNQLFAMLREAVQACLQLGENDEKLLACARIHFFTMHGMVTLYANSDEPNDALMERLGATFDLAADVMLAGFKDVVRLGAKPE